MNPDITAALNNTQCVVIKNHFGYDTIINLCSGKVSNIDWAFGDWAAFGALGSMALIFIVVLVGIACIILDI